MLKCSTVRAELPLQAQQQRIAECGRLFGRAVLSDGRTAKESVERGPPVAGVGGLVRFQGVMLGESR